MNRRGKLSQHVFVPAHDVNNNGTESISRSGLGTYVPDNLASDMRHFCGGHRLVTVGEPFVRQDIGPSIP